MITVVAGPPCSGKTTFVLESRGAADVVIDFDAIAMAMGCENTRKLTKSADQFRVAAAARVAAIARVFDGVESDSWIIQSFLEPGTVSKWSDLGAKFVIVDPGIEECLARAEKLPGASVLIETIRQWYESPPVIPEQNLLKGNCRVNRKIINLDIKADEGLQPGQFAGYAAVFGNIDSYGDKIVKGAFSNSLKEYGNDGSGIPAYWCHRMDDPEMNIGQTVSAVEDDHGLKVVVQLDLENPKAVYTHKLIKSGRVGQMSFAFDIVESRIIDEKTGPSFRQLDILKIHEVSVVPVGANQETELLAVKTGTMAKTSPDPGLSEKLNNLLSVLLRVCDDLQAVVSNDLGDSDENQDSGNDEDPEAGKSEDPKIVKSDELSAGMAQILLENLKLATLGSRKIGESNEYVRRTAGKTY